MGLFLFVSVLPSLSQVRGAINSVKIPDQNAETIRPPLYDIDMTVQLSCISTRSSEYILAYGFDADPWEAIITE